MMIHPKRYRDATDEREGVGMQICVCDTIMWASDVQFRECREEEILSCQIEREKTLVEGRLF